MVSTTTALVFSLMFSGPPTVDPDATPATAETDSGDSGDSGDTGDSGDSGDTDGAAAEPTRFEPEPPPDVPLSVAVAGSAPFVEVDDGRPSGIAVAVWEAVAGKAGYRYELEFVDSVSAAIDDVQAGRYDVAVGPISITAERAGRVSFTQPYHQSPLAIVTTSDSSTAWDRIRPFFTKAFVVGLGILLIVLGLVGVAFWITERKENPEQFPQGAVEGIGAGLWLALVTMTTVGYGDKAPVSRGGKVVAGAWMLISMITASSLTASIATAFTLSQFGGGAIESPDELAGRRVAVLEGSPAAVFAEGQGARSVRVSDVGAGLARVAEGKVDAFVHDRAVIVWELERFDGDGAGDLVLAPGKYEPRGYGFAVTRGSDLVHTLDLAVLEVKESGLLGDLLHD